MFSVFHYKLLLLLYDSMALLWYSITILYNYVLLYNVFVLFGVPLMAINVSVYSMTVGFSPILYCWPNVTTYHTGTHLTVLTFPPLTVGCSEGLDAIIFFYKYYTYTTYSTLSSALHIFVKSICSTEPPRRHNFMQSTTRHKKRSTISSDVQTVDRKKRRHSSPVLFERCNHLCALKDVAVFFAREVLQDRNLAQGILVQPSPRLPDLLSAHFLSQQQNKGSHMRKVTQDFPTFLLRCLPKFLSREGFSIPFPSWTVGYMYEEYTVDRVR